MTRDIIREIAEMDPGDHDTCACFFCEEKWVFNGLDGDIDYPHDPDCLWVYCVEQVKQQRTGDDPV